MSEPRRTWEDEQPEQPHVWRTLGYRRVSQAGGESVLEWDAPPEYAFPAGSGPIMTITRTARDTGRLYRADGVVALVPSLIAHARRLHEHDAD